MIMNCTLVHLLTTAYVCAGLSPGFDLSALHGGGYQCNGHSSLKVANNVPKSNKLNMKKLPHTDTNTYTSPHTRSDTHAWPKVMQNFWHTAT